MLKIPAKPLKDAFKVISKLLTDTEKGGLSRCLRLTIKENLLTIELNKITSYLQTKIPVEYTGQAAVLIVAYESINDIISYIDETLTIEIVDADNIYLHILTGKIPVKLYNYTQASFDRVTSTFNNLNFKELELTKVTKDFYSNMPVALNTSAKSKKIKIKDNKAYTNLGYALLAMNTELPNMVLNNIELGILALLDNISYVETKEFYIFSFQNTVLSFIKTNSKDLDFIEDSIKKIPEGTLYSIDGNLLTKVLSVLNLHKNANAYLKTKDNQLFLEYVDIQAQKSIFDLGTCELEINYCISIQNSLNLLKLFGDYPQFTFKYINGVMYPEADTIKLVYPEVNE